MALDRRRFIKLTTVGVVAAVTDAACARDRGGDTPVDHPQLISVLGADRVRQLGMRYRTATPSEYNADALRSAIAKGRGLRVFGYSIADQIEDDFAEGRTVLVDGWILSVTEARQAALFSLTPA